jgi:hypothetical protein
MKIIELLEADLNLADALRAAAEEQKAAQQPKIGQPTDPNAVQQPTGTQGTQGTAAPAQVNPGGSQTAGTAKKPMGIGASFAAGLTKGKSQQLGPDGKPIGLLGVAKQGVKNIAANSLGMSNTVAAMGGAPAAIQKPEELGMAFKPGQTIDLPNVGKIKVTKSGPQGIELDTSQASSIGVPKLTLNPKDLLQK